MKFCINTGSHGFPLLFQISFPSGAFVRVHMHRWYGNLWYANIQVQVVSDDFKCTEGLCGTFDGDRSNELKAKGGRVIQSPNGAVAPAQFTESWKYVKFFILSSISLRST